MLPWSERNTECYGLKKCRYHSDETFSENRKCCLTSYETLYDYPMHNPNG